MEGSKWWSSNIIEECRKHLVEILKKKANFTITDVDSTVLELPKPTRRYVGLLKEHTEKARFISGNAYFKFSEEDGMRTFNKREYLSDQPKYKLYAICKELNLKKYRKLALYSLVSLILKQPNINEIILKLISEDQHIKISDEDIEGIKAEYFKHH